MSSDDDSGPGEDSDAGEASDAAPRDAAPIEIFGTDCPTGTVYTEPFVSDPIADGTFTSLVGSYTYNAAGQSLSLAASSANTQMWIGPRPSWTNYTVSVPLRIDSEGTNGNGGITFRMESTPTSPANNAGAMYYAGIATNQVLVGIENGDWKEFSGPSVTIAVGTFHTLQVSVAGSSISVSVDGSAYVTNYSDGTYTYGAIGLRTYASGVTYGAITVTCN